MLKKIYFLASLMTAFTITPIAYGASFEDNFSDGIIDSSIYRPLENGIIEESSGTLNVTVNDIGDGVDIFLDEVIPDAQWIKMDFSMSDFLIGEGLKFEVFSGESDTISDFDLTVLIDEVLVESSGNSLLLNENEKNCAIRVNVSIDFANTRQQIIHLDQPCSEIDAFKGFFRIDWIPKDGKWKYDFGTASGDTNNIPNIINDIVIPKLNPPNNTDKKIERIAVNFQTFIPRDPIFSIDNFGAEVIHRSTNENTSSKSIVMLGILLTGFSLSKKLVNKNKK
ncbi:MAG: hypothetical protein F6K23_23695 [Okeania sp. SIO2C9]|uniref:hypothetical protein n=1 Tax=Okeania sp. SIO2C9 TaxID=2607791 RepID=UPI0013BF6775|nr:hypothetical protein [Okeania sp. SIO2C9]NEQ75779.1 hypothetical protein [Okeania sp. SIO2C9]